MEVLNKLHASIAEACEYSFDQAYKELQIICATHNAKFQAAEKDALSANEARQVADHNVEELQREVSALREELGHYEHSTSELEPPESLLSLADEFDPEQIWHAHHQSPEHLQEILRNKYTMLYNDLQTFVRSWSSLRAKVLQHKKKLLHWEKQLERDEFTLQLHGKPVTFRKLHVSASKDVNETAASTHLISGTQNCLDFQVTQGSSNVADFTEANSTGTKDDTPAGNAGLPVTVSDQSPRNRSQSICTKRDSASSDSSSETVHSLPEIQNRKRKRDTAISDSQSTNRPVRVKHEPLSSSPVQLTTHSLDRQLPSTQDLDEVGDTVQTPRKRNRHRVGWEAPTAEDHQTGVCPSLPPSRRASQQPSVLRPLDGNARMSRCNHQSSDFEKTRRTDRWAVSMLAEDGDFEGCDCDHHKQPRSNFSTARKLPLKFTTGGRGTQNRLEGLLEGTSPAKSALTSTDKIQSASGLHSLARNSTRLEKQSIHEDASASRLPEVHPEDEPYRSRPLQRLNLSHFKINPARNKGLDFAYDAVVRRKDDRKCLSGCTRPGCCGDGFRAMARLSGLPTSHFKEKETEDQRILEDYVGDDRSLLQGLNVHDREDLLIEARARDLANRYAKHRHAHQRARTPPGFWRTEMPSTQELESDREAAQRVEREMVEERYREAMRPGGIWTWADE